MVTDYFQDSSIKKRWLRKNFDTDGYFLLQLVGKIESSNVETRGTGRDNQRQSFGNRRQSVGKDKRKSFFKLPWTRSSGVSDLPVEHRYIKDMYLTAENASSLTVESKLCFLFQQFDLYWLLQELSSQFSVRQAKLELVKI